MPVMHTSYWPSLVTLALVPRGIEGNTDYRKP